MLKIVKLIIFSLSLQQALVYGCKSKVTDPVITSWIQTTGNGYNSIEADVKKVQYSDNYVYVSANSIPSYDIGPWPNNPNDATAQDFTYKFTRNPSENTGTKTTVGLGAMGMWSNGVVIFNADDGQTYNNEGVWKRNAYVWEGESFDICSGHPDQSGTYHNHINPICMYTTESSSHSPIIGYAFDGYPIYGPYGYTDPDDSSSAIKRIETSYDLRTDNDRTTLPDGTTASAAGPSIDATYPLGSFIQDYLYTAGSGDLDEYNGRFGKTPDYPDGIYAYFVATDSNLDPVYPFVVGPSYYGNVESSNIGPTAGSSVPTESVETYVDSGSSNLISSSYIKTQILGNILIIFFYSLFN